MPYRGGRYVSGIIDVVGLKPLLTRIAVADMEFPLRRLRDERCDGFTRFSTFSVAANARWMVIVVREKLLQVFDGDLSGVFLNELAKSTQARK